MKLLSVLALVCLASFTAAANTLRAAKPAAPRPIAMVAANTTQLTGLACSVCTDALEAAISIGCSGGSEVLAAICLDFAPVCEAALEVLCELCADECTDTDCYEQLACSKVGACPSPLSDDQASC